MKVHLLNVGAGPGRRLFYPEPAEDEESTPAPAPRGGLRGWAEARLGRVRDRWQHSEGRGVRAGRDAWAWLQRRAHPDEALLARLRKAGSVEVVHPATMTGEEAAAEWSVFLSRSRRRHWPWFLANALVSPLTIVLAALPGPNVVGYWFAYRATHHGLILAGLRKALSGRLESAFRPDEATEPGPVPPPGCDPEEFAGFLRRHGVGPPVCLPGDGEVPSRDRAGRLRRDGSPGRLGPGRGVDPVADSCDCSATTSIKGSAGETGSTGSDGSSTSSGPKPPT